MNKILPIVLCFDNNYAAYGAVTIQSVIYNADPEIQYQLFVLHRGVAPEYQEKIVQLAADHAHVEVTFIDVTEHQLKNTYLRTKEITVATYDRFLIPQLFADQYERVLYIDSDLVVNDSLKGLLDIDLTGHAIAGVRCGWCSQMLLQEGGLKDLGFNQAYARSVLGMTRMEEYVNAGVLLFNLSYFKEHNQIHGLQAISETIEKPIFQDQCLINAFAQKTGGPLMLDRSYNVHINAFPGACYMQPNEKTAGYTVHYEEEPKILHFIGGAKPWGRDVPNGSYFWFYAMMLPDLFWQMILSKNPHIQFDWRHRDLLMWVHALKSHQQASKRDEKNWYQPNLPASGQWDFHKINPFQQLRTQPYRPAWQQKLAGYLPKRIKSIIKKRFIKH